MGVPALDIAAGIAALLLFGFVVWSIFEAPGRAIEDDTETHDSSMTEGWR